jgi:DNA-binding response OmpR family regulator
MAGIQILVVEDDAMHAKLVRFLLEDAGHTVQVAESGENALEVLLSFRPELILMDLQLPGLDGFETTRRLRLNSLQAVTPIVVLSAYLDPSVLAMVREAGCIGSIPKPIDPASFARQVRDHIAPNRKDEPGTPSDSGDLLFEVRNKFLAEGLEHCDRLLNNLKSNPDGALRTIHGLLHGWAAAAGTLGFPEIWSQVSRISALLTSSNLDHDEVVKSIETARRRFWAGTRHEPDLPVELITGLMDVRVGLVNMSAEEINRIQFAAKRANIKAVFEQIDGDSVENEPGCGALIINECGRSTGLALRRPLPSVPAVFIGSRSSLEALCKLPSRGYDFTIAPWETEEVLMRVYRLIGRPAFVRSTEESQLAQKRRPRILIADDDPDMVFLVSDALGQFGMDCDVARSGQQVLDLVHKQPPDALVLDVNMNDLSGFEILERLRQNLATKTLPVVLLTARNQGRDIARGFGSGADDYVVKPFQASDLARRVQKAIADSRKTRGS